MSNPQTIKLKGFWPDHMDTEEARIINRLITAILKDGYRIAVREGEEGDTMCPPTTCRGSIQNGVAATGVTLIDAHHDFDPVRSERVATIVLIHGNGEDVISDASWNGQVPELEQLVNAWCDHANEVAS